MYSRVNSLSERFWSCMWKCLLQIISGKIILNHGDRLIIGGNHYFKVLNPHDDQPSNVKQVIDYDFAHQEILRVQEQKCVLTKTMGQLVKIELRSFLNI